jgi:hypothetical protein
MRVLILLLLLPGATPPPPASVYNPEPCMLYRTRLICKGRANCLGEWQREPLQIPARSRQYYADRGCIIVHDCISMPDVKELALIGWPAIPKFKAYSLTQSELTREF